VRSQLMKSGLEKYPHRSLLKAMGLTDQEIDRPLIGIANSFNELIPGHIHLDKITQAAAAGVRLAGGTPLQFGVIGVCDGLAMHHQGMKYSLASRELICDSIEIMATAHPLDGLVLVANCDKIVPGMLMAALRLNIPAVLISGGPMLAGRFKGQEVDLISVFEGVGAVKAGRMTESELADLAECACPGCGSCAGMFTANSMNCLSEALGLALPGNGTIPAVHAARFRLELCVRQYLRCLHSGAPFVIGACVVRKSNSVRGERVKWTDNREHGYLCVRISGKIHAVFDRNCRQRRPVGRNENMMIHRSLLISLVRIEGRLCLI